MVLYQVWAFVAPGLYSHEKKLVLPLVVSKVQVPIIAAGGITDGCSMAAAFALGAEGVQMGTRMVSATESPVHDNWKQAIVRAAETDTVFLNRFSKPGLRALRTERTTRLEHQEHVEMSVPVARGSAVRAVVDPPVARPRWLSSPAGGDLPS